jgi:hypothetical protein
MQPNPKQMQTNPGGQIYGIALDLEKFEVGIIVSFFIGFHVE